MCAYIILLFSVLGFLYRNSIGNLFLTVYILCVQRKESVPVLRTQDDYLTLF